ncbi:hypothetical protein HYC85_027536 [Camellia sinensis]|uniref:L-arabinokinase n=1 Tax=Camellia sinensis TaxID=4442 RepID=A0A7J7G708_CAMSI|nr:hypothetical protein HYC85_027536 [Camellia sinensis]
MRIEDGSDQVSASTKHLVFAYYVTGHGFGHATRVVEVVRHLILAGHDVHVVTGAPDFVFTTEIQSPRLFLRKLVLDCGAVQADALTVDRLASLEKYSETAVKPRDSILATEVEWLNSIKADLVVSDVVPVACRAAADAGIRWDFIYAEYVMAAGNHHRSIVWQIAEDYSHCEFLIRLPGYCPMPAFRDAIDVPLVVRRFHKSRKEARKELGIGEDVKLVILNFGGQPAGWKLKEEYLPSGWLCLVCGASDNTELPPNFIKLARDVYTPDVIAASDCMLGKIGYGTVSEALAYKLPFIFYFQGGVEMIRRDLLTGQWKPYLERAVSLKPCYEGGINGGEDTAVGKNYASDKLSGARRLRDAIVLGYQLQRVPGRDLCIPDWYANAENELGRRTGSPTANMTENSFHMNYTEDFEILHGDLQGLQDTMNFLNSLAELDAVNDSGKNTEKPWMRERMAAAGIFNWEEEIFVARAPGRLDVVGGIADYSGSLVLQMPIREACHVAVQRNDPSKQRLWKHAQSRQNAKGQGSTPVLQISYFLSSPMSPSSLQGEPWCEETPVSLPSPSVIATPETPVSLPSPSVIATPETIITDDPPIENTDFPSAVKDGKVYVRDKGRQKVTWVQETNSDSPLLSSSSDECPKSSPSGPVSSVSLPSNFQDALSTPEWKHAMMEEMRALAKNGTWELAALPKGKRPVGCKWVYTVKHKADGSIERYKARLVAKGDDVEEVPRLKEYLANEFEIKDLGKLKYFLGIEVARSKDGIFICQRKYVLDLLKETGMLGSKACDTPLEPGLKLSEDEGGEPVDRGRYQRLVGKLIYLSHSRPDIAIAVSMVSYGSELSNRSPTFDMDLSDFMDGEQPISYQKAKEYFARDPSQRWAAYVAGVILVLMMELGVRFKNSISMLVSSAVPEGKGVSSSASVEVASMSAIAAAHGLDISPRDLALLCQKVENHVVGAPCGVMDQMTSACGEANKLLAMICQPAEVIGLVAIPSHIRFWGIDSGIRHSIGGADYGSVRVGAFIGRKMIKSIASAMLSQSLSSANGNIDELNEDGVELLQAEASLDYLCNLLPHRYEALYCKQLPDSMLGEKFLEQFVDHDDPVTIIDHKRSYGVRAAARHPMYENFRVKAFKALLTSAASDEQLTALGELMYQCHYSYSACGLGSNGTERLVQLVQEMQHNKMYNTEDRTLYGAKITGGGSGGTICVIGRNCLRSSQHILEIQQRYKAATGYLPFLFEGSSPGAGKFGYLRIRRRNPPKLQ